MTEITRIWPGGPVVATDDALTDWYHASVPVDRPWLRANFVSSVDGSATHAGRSGGLGDDADRRVFQILRRRCDAIVVGAGTVRIEGYAGPLVDASTREHRRAHGLAADPTLVIVSERLELDGDSALFSESPVRPIVVTGTGAPAEKLTEIRRVADVLVCPSAGRVSTTWMTQELARRGLTHLTSEGGPHLLGSMVSDGALDELCLTVSAQIELADGPRIAAGPALGEAYELNLAHVLIAGDTLLLRYLHPRADSHP